MTTIEPKGRDPTGARLFFQLLHNARLAKKADPRINPRAFLLGMFHAFLSNREDFTIADDQRSVWKSQNSRAE